MSTSERSSIRLHREVFIKTLVFGGTALVALAAATHVRAADVLLTAPALVPVYNWSTCYVGGNVGYGSSLNESITFTGSDEAAFFSTNQFPRYIAVKPKGAIAGARSAAMRSLRHGSSASNRIYSGPTSKQRAPCHRFLGRGRNLRRPPPKAANGLGPFGGGLGCW